MEALLVAPAATIVAVAALVVRRSRAEPSAGQLIDLADDAPPLGLADLRAGLDERDYVVSAPVTGEKSLGARLLAADRAKTRPRPVVGRRRTRGEPLVADR